MDYTAFRLSHNSCNVFWIIFHQIYVTADETPSVGTYLQYENSHMIFVIEINTRIVDMARPKSSLCLYTSTYKPINALQLHKITVTM